MQAKLFYTGDCLANNNHYRDSINELDNYGSCSFSAVKTFRGDSNNNEVSFDIKIKGSKAIYFVIENGGNAEIKNITLVKNNNDTENLLDQSDWLSEKGKLIKKYALSKDKNFTRIKGMH